VAVSEKLDGYLYDKEGQQNVVDDLVDLTQDIYLLDLLGKS
jgi:hypothetical protein